MRKKALITGITGQDGAYLAQLLLQKGYEVIGGARRSASINLWRLDELGIRDDVKLVSLELLELNNMLRVLQDVQPDEIYNLGAQSFVAQSFETPLYTAEADGMGVLRFLEAIRTVNPNTKFYQASTSEMFGKVQQTPQTECTPFYPRSPYGVAKLFGHWMTVNYRESYDMFACSGILFNHESPLRGLEFVTRKITSGLAEIKHGRQECLELGNIDSKRDWGFAGDFVEGMWLMLQQDQADDYVLGTGETNTVRKFVDVAATVLGMNIEWSGSAEKEIGTDSKSGKIVVKINPQFYRPAEVDLLIGDPIKAHSKLNWNRKMSFEGLATAMAESDDRRAALGPIRN